MSGSFPFNISYLFLYQFSLGKMVLSLKVRKVKTRNRKMKLCAFVLDHFCHELQANYFPQSSRAISLVDPTQRLFHPNPLPCLFYLVDRSSVIIQIHALPLQRRQSCNDGLVQEQQLGLFFSQFFSLEKANILESQKSCQFFSSLLFNLRKMDSRAVNKYLHSVKCWLVIHWFYTTWWMVALTVSTAEKVEEELRRATVVEKHSCDNTSGWIVQPCPELLPHSSQKHTSEATYAIPAHTLWKQVGHCLRSCLRWEEEDVKEAAKELVTMEIL